MIMIRRNTFMKKKQNTADIVLVAAAAGFKLFS